MTAVRPVVTAGEEGEDGDGEETRMGVFWGTDIVG